ncbi:hypothetical protein MYX78_01780 [Acidobacteria bacterium AH-259-G07]|nr:hypothetical protein [Acidobacteria bacterium AH-259-G07]
MPNLTKREREILEIVKKLGMAHPREISQMMGISAGYAEQLCRDLVWQRELVRRGLRFEVAPTG